MFGKIDSDGNITISNTFEVNNVRYDWSNLISMDKDQREGLGIYPVCEYTYDPETYIFSGYDYNLIDGNIVGKPILTQIDPIELKRKSDMRLRNTAISELAELDRYLPRGLEDLIDVLLIDIKTLPQIQQDRLARKSELRNILKETSYVDENRGI